MTTRLGTSALFGPGLRARQLDKFPRALSPKGESIKVFVQTRADHTPSDALAARLIERVLST